MSSFNRNPVSYRADQRNKPWRNAFIKDEFAPCNNLPLSFASAQKTQVLTKPREIDSLADLPLRHRGCSTD